MKKINIKILVICAILMTCICLCLAGCVESGQKEEGEPKEAEIDLDEAVSYIELPKGFKPKIGIVLGSGLEKLADEVKVAGRVSYDDIPTFPHSTVKGHKGEFIFAYVNKVPVILMNGRIHYYEGYTMEEVVTPDRIMALLGAKTVILTNSAGSLDPKHHPGDLVCITDHISSFVPSPLIGQNDEELGERFVDMTNVYDDKLRKKLHQSAEKENIKLKDGIYIQVTGPAFETKAEAEHYADCGANIVGMSTACETIALRHMGVKVLGLSCVTNYCPNCAEKGTSHEEVQKTADKASEKMVRLVKEVVSRI